MRVESYGARGAAEQPASQPSSSASLRIIEDTETKPTNTQVTAHRGSGGARKSRLCNLFGVIIIIADRWVSSNGSEHKGGRRNKERSRHDAAGRTNWPTNTLSHERTVDAVDTTGSKSRQAIGRKERYRRKYEGPTTNGGWLTVHLVDAR